jgi:hypothetical protein
VLSGFRKLDDLPSDGLTNRVGVVGRGAERSQRDLEGNTHQTDGFAVEAMAVQEGPDRHEDAALIAPRRSATAAGGMCFNRNLPAVKVREVATNECAGRCR